jgi:hypothetical protein
MIKKIWHKIPVGTRSVLIGAHCFFLHPFFVAAGWTKLYGFPFDPRLWIVFLLHDVGYLGKKRMDDDIGETHPELGAKIVGFLFGKEWHDFSLFHSRYYSKRCDTKPSKLCFADKLAFVYTPKNLYLKMVTLTGEIDEYLQNAQKSDSEHWTPTNFDKDKWHDQLKLYFINWVSEHKNGVEDTWTTKRYGSCAK